MSAVRLHNPILKMLEQLFGGKRAERLFAEYKIAVKPTGFDLLKGSEKLESAMWPSIVSIIAYKQDLITTDLICFELTFLTGSVVEINEEMDGFESFLNMAERKLPTFDRLWPDKVVLPPFAVNRTVVYTGIFQDVTATLPHTPTASA